MLLLLWILNTSLWPIAESVADEPPSSWSEGLKNSEEPAFLWTQGQKELSTGNAKQATFYLTRLVDRYPHDPRVLEAQEELGTIWLRLHEPELAIPPLKYVIEAKNQLNEGLRARLLLARAFLMLSKNDQAYLVAEEIRRSRGFSSLTSDMRGEYLLIRSWALLGKNQEKDIPPLLLEFSKILGQGWTHHRLESEALYLKFEIKLKECEDLAFKGTTSDESFWFESLEKQKQCLLEVLVLARESVHRGDTDILEKIDDSLSHAYKKYSEYCKNAVVTSTKWTQAQTTQNILELRQRAMPSCQKTFDEGTALLEKWISDANATAGESWKIKYYEKQRKSLNDQRPA